MKPLHDLRVLLLGTGEHDEHLKLVWLQSEGAAAFASDWQNAHAAVQRHDIQVVVADLRHSVEQADAFLTRLRTDGSPGDVRVLALVDSEPASSMLDAGIYRYLVAPLHPAALTAALADIAGADRVVSRVSAPSCDELVATLLAARAALCDIRGVAGLVNASGPFRFTSVLRIDKDDALVSFWTYDREQPEVNRLTDGTPISASYCSRVREENAPFVVMDASADLTLLDHPARHTVLSYCGVPLARADGSFYGTLSSYDVVSRFVAETTLRRLVEASRSLQQNWSELSGPLG